MEMPLVDNGNMKRFHKSFLSTYASLGMIQRRNGRDFSNGLKTLGLPCPSMIVTAVVGLKLNQCTTICWFPRMLLFVFRVNLYELDYVVIYFQATL